MLEGPQLSTQILLQMTFVLRDSSLRFPLFLSTCEWARTRMSPGAHRVECRIVRSWSYWCCELSNVEAGNRTSVLLTTEPSHWDIFLISWVGVGKNFFLNSWAFLRKSLGISGICWLVRPARPSPLISAPSYCWMTVFRVSRSG